MLRNAALAAFVVFASPLIAAAAGSSRPINFLPPNKLSIPVGSLEAKGLTEKEFNQVIDQVSAIYAPVIAARGGKLQVNRLWDNDTVNASAERDGDVYVVNMYGGLARHETITQDGFALVVCHELGHHLGGAPKFAEEGNTWASVEGQADYFANLKCLRRVFASSGAKAFTRMASDDHSFAAAACAKSFSSPQDQAVCLRGATAGMSVTALFRALRSEDAEAHFDTPDPAKVAETDGNHPGTQCRLDTYFQGSICAKPVSEGVDDKDPAAGACTRSQGFGAGLRPRCWYKPPAGEPDGLLSQAQRPVFSGSAALSSLEQPRW